MNTTNSIKDDSGIVRQSQGIYQADLMYAKHVILPAEGVNSSQMSPKEILDRAYSIISNLSQK